MSDAAAIGRDWALFLDLDGTLLDIAPKPDLVEVPGELPYQLTQLRTDLGGALAIVSGRSLETIDRLLAPFRGPGAGEHGAVVRLPGGGMDVSRCNPVPRQWVDILNHAAERWDGLLIERKPRSIVVHYRLAPEREDEVRALVEGLPGLWEESFAVMAAHMAFEVKPKVSSKARAVALLMETPPFAGRRPVFVGDDVTDEEGLDMARRLGGFGLRVGEAFEGGPGGVRRWIARGLQVRA